MTEFPIGTAAHSKTTINSSLHISGMRHLPRNVRSTNDQMNLFTRLPSFGVCSESPNDFEARAYGERRRPSVRHSVGVVRPAPNTRHFHQWKPDESQTRAIPTFHQPRLGPPSGPVTAVTDSGQLPSAAVSSGGKISSTAIRPTMAPSITTGTDCPGLKMRGFP